jgi:hypothetical protein
LGVRQSRRPGLLGEAHASGLAAVILNRTRHRLFVTAYREALRALHDTGVPIRPRATWLIEWIPVPVQVLAWRLFLNTSLAVVGGQRHANAAPDEMKELADEIRTILRRAGHPSPASDALYAEIDKRFQSQIAGPAAPPSGEPTAAIGLYLQRGKHICRNEGVTDTHIYAPNGIISQGLLTLSAITAQPFLPS